MKKNNFDPFMVNSFSEIIKQANHTSLNTSNISDNGLTGMTFMEKSAGIYMPRVKIGLVLLVTSDALGEKNGLGESLLKGVLESVSEGIELPEYAIFINTGVKTLADEKNLEIFKKLKKYGTNVIASLESLEYFSLLSKCKLASKWSIGEVTAILTNAIKIIRI